MTRGLKYAEQARRVARAHELRKFSSGYVDATGMGGPVAEQLHDEVSPLIRPFVFTASSKPPLFERLRALAVDGRLVFRPGLEEQVRDDVRAVKRVVTPEGKIKFQAERSDKGHADLVSALVLALAAWNDMPCSFGDPQAAPYTGRFGDRADLLGPRFSRLTPPF
jgi:phage FluMu gp28-like protein